MKTDFNMTMTDFNMTMTDYNMAKTDYYISMSDYNMTKTDYNPSLQNPVFDLYQSCRKDTRNKRGFTNKINPKYQHPIALNFVDKLKTKACR